MTTTPKTGTRIANAKPVLTGITAREWFAGQALAGILAASKSAFQLDATAIAEAAYDYADAMIDRAALSETKESDRD